MATVVKLTYGQTGKAGPFPVPIAPFSDDQIEQIKRAFTEQGAAKNWCGYAVMNQIPDLMEACFTAPPATPSIGVILFFHNTAEPQFLFRRDSDPASFGRFDLAGKTLLEAPTLPLLLDGLTSQETSP
ncbi:hypothetical protein [Sneathiella chinensis]|uniref:Uncharacterized protein n=1 Tax=Sneathiella chinensis TaxID=349750 RepID=A0ABQ5U3G1_9PROT|nr:hypothetical protein [Sneathiella chinensis]GLQ06368.1 hypothetical protein GCM10007924_15890 [Sneathiella chinensis]